MTDTVMKHDVSPMGRTLANWGVALMSLVFMGWGLIDLVRFQVTSDLDMNPATWENHVWWWGLLLGLFFIFAAGTSCNTPGGEFLTEQGLLYEPCQWLQRVTGIHAFPWFLAMVAAFPAAAILVMHVVPHHLYTPAGHVRVMDDGRVFTAGQSVVSDRYASHSALVPLTRSISVSYDLPGPAHALSATMQVDFNLVSNQSLRQLLARHPRELGTGQGEGTRDRLQAAFFRRQVGIYLQPKLVVLEREVGANQLSGSRSALNERLGRLFDHSNDRPAWLSPLTVSGLEFSSVTNTAS